MAVEQLPTLRAGRKGTCRDRRLGHPPETKGWKRRAGSTATGEGPRRQTGIGAPQHRRSTTIWSLSDVPREHQVNDVVGARVKVIRVSGRRVVGDKQVAGIRRIG